MIINFMAADQLRHNLEAFLLTLDLVIMEMKPRVLLLQPLIISEMLRHKGIEKNSTGGLNKTLTKTS